MCQKSPSTVALEAFQESLPVAIAKARSLEEIEAWLRAQQGVKSVQLADYLLKSYPPQRDFIVEFLLPDRSTVKKVVNIFDSGDQQYQFHKLRDQ
jgi:hypothetical protein